MARLLLLLMALPWASAFPSTPLLVRDTTCSAAGLEACPASLPTNFCCPSGSACQPLAGNTTAVCCPEGNTCDKIQPIPCDAGQQDPRTDLNVPIKTTVFDVPLGLCGSGMCCPFGYTCAGGTACKRDADQSKSPAGSQGSSSAPPSSQSASAPASSSSSSSSSSSTSTRSSATSAPSSSSSSSRATAQPPSSSPGPVAAAGSLSQESSPPATPAPPPAPTPGDNGSAPAPPPPSPPTSTSTTAGPPPAPDKSAANPKRMSIIGGIIGASAVVLIICVITFLFIRRGRDRPHPSSPQPSLGGSHSGSEKPPRKPRRGGNISGPIVQDTSYRTDFILKRPKASSLRASLFRKSSSYSSSSTNNHQRAPPMPDAPLPSTASALTAAKPDTHGRMSIPNPFDSPGDTSSPEHAPASASPHDDPILHDSVSKPRLPPIRGMKVSSARAYPQSLASLGREPSSDTINVFAEPAVVGWGPGNWRGTCGTTFTDLMDEADLGDVRRGKPYVPGNQS